MNNSEPFAKLLQMLRAEDEPTLGVIGTTHDLSLPRIKPVEEQFLWNGVFLRIRDEILSHLSIQVVGPFRAIENVRRYGHPVGLFLIVIGVNQYAHSSKRMINSIEFPLLYCPKIPQASEDLLDGIPEMPLVDSMRTGVIESCPANPGRSSLFVLERQRREVPSGNEALCATVAVYLVSVSTSEVAGPALGNAMFPPPRNARNLAQKQCILPETH